MMQQNQEQARGCHCIAPADTAVLATSSALQPAVIFYACSSITTLLYL
jgi:hypothetical protein